MFILFVDPMSYHNMAEYDYQLFSRLNLNHKLFIGNNRYNYKDISICKLYRYSEKKNRLLKSLSYLYSQVRLFVIAIKEKPDIIHFQWLKMYYVDLIFIKIVKLINKNTVFVYTAHNVLPHENPEKYRKIFEKIYNIFDGIITHTQKAKEEITNCFLKNNGGKCVVIPHGLLQNKVDKKRVEQKKHQMSQKAAFKNSIVISYLGKFRKYKGIDYIVNAISSSNSLKNNKEILFVLAGEGDAKLIDSVKSYDNFYIKNKFLSNEEFQAFLELSDIILLPYKKIAQSGLLLTAVAAKVPLIVSDVGGLTEPFLFGMPGWILKKGNETESLKTLLEYLADKGKKDILRIKDDNEMWKKIHSYYSWEKIAHKTMSFYSELHNK